MPLFAVSARIKLNYNGTASAGKLSVKIEVKKSTALGRSANNKLDRQVKKYRK